MGGYDNTGIVIGLLTLLILFGGLNLVLAFVGNIYIIGKQKDWDWLLLPLIGGGLAVGEIFFPQHTTVIIHLFIWWQIAVFIFLCLKKWKKKEVVLSTLFSFFVWGVWIVEVVVWNLLYWLTVRSDLPPEEVVGNRNMLIGVTILQVVSWYYLLVYYYSENEKRRKVIRIVSYCIMILVMIFILFQSVEWENKIALVETFPLLLVTDIVRKNNQKQNEQVVQNSQK